MNLEKRPAVGIYFLGDIDLTAAIRGGFKAISTSSIITLALQTLSLRIEKFPELHYDKHALLSDDCDEKTRVNREISIRRKQITSFLKAEFPQLCNSTYSKERSIENIELFAKLPALQKIVTDAISPFFEEDDYIVYGTPLELKFPSSYIIKPAKFSEALDGVTRRRQRFDAIRSEQRILSIKRSDFEWGLNQWLVPIRKLFHEEIEAEVARYQSFSEFDLAIQLLMHLGARKTSDLWDEKSQTVNARLVRNEIKRLAVELDTYFKQLRGNIDGREIQLPFSDMNGFSRDPFLSFKNRPELSLSQKEYLKDSDETKLIVREKYSGKRIIFAKVHPGISSLYSKAFCNLHYANPGEIAVFGAYLEGDELPFAYSSYGQISYQYTKDMLSYMGFSNGEIVESSRAWNAQFSPENTMSALFTYSQERIAEEFPGVRGVLTAINPNLGFAASAFRGIHFEVVSLKPTIFSYQLKNGLPYFRSKRDIAQELGMKIGDLVEGKHYINNQIPFLPTIEMLYLYNKNERKKLRESPIYIVSENEYINNR